MKLGRSEGKVVGEATANPATFRAGVYIFVFLAVLGLQLYLIALIGTDIPFQDQWNIEGVEIYPKIVDGSWRWTDLFRSYNEHRITATVVLDILLFRLNGQWDPLVQLVVGAILHGFAAAVICRGLFCRWSRGGVIFGGLAVVMMASPLHAWANALWGIQSIVYFSLILSLGAFIPLLGSSKRRWQVVSYVLIVAALFTMSAGLLAPLALLGVAGLRLSTGSRNRNRDWLLTLGMAAMFIGAWVGRDNDAALVGLRVKSMHDFVRAFVCLLSWPHPGSFGAACIMIAPMAAIIVERLLFRRPAGGESDFAVAVFFWACLIAAAEAWARGGSDEFLAGVPWRYVDFCAVSVVANIWASVMIVQSQWRWTPAVGRALLAAWMLFLFIGWLGVGLSVARGVVTPRCRDRDAPVRLVREFQRTGDVAIFAGQPRLLTPHPNLEVLRRVINDPRMQSHLPPSLQPSQPMGPLSRVVRWLLRRPI